jgi:hypothetical protein
MDNWLFQLLRVVVETAWWVVALGVGNLVRGIIEHTQGVLLGLVVGLPVAVAKILRR